VERVGLNHNVDHKFKKVLGFVGTEPLSNCVRVLVRLIESPPPQNAVTASLRSTPGVAQPLVPRRSAYGEADLACIRVRKRVFERWVTREGKERWARPDEGCPRAPATLKLRATIPWSRSGHGVTENEQDVTGSPRRRSRQPREK